MLQKRMESGVNSTRKGGAFFGAVTVPGMRSGAGGTRHWVALNPGESCGPRGASSHGPRTGIFCLALEIASWGG